MAGGVYAYARITSPAPSSDGCSPLGGKAELKTTLSSTNITAITEWALPNPGRFPNGITTAPDGSVWFGEQSLPGVAHFFPSNGTLVEYAWPASAQELQGSCQFKSSIWGVALWDGMVWAADGAGNTIIGLNPTNDTFVTLTLPQTDSVPYTLAVGPDGALWFTTLTSPAYLGRISPDLDVSMYPVLNFTTEVPSDLDFVNSTFAYYSGLDPFQPNMSGVFSFDPQQVAGGITATRVGGNVTLYDTTSVSSAEGSVWVVQHYTSNLWGYDVDSHEWVVYPTSTENYTVTTLPYFVRTSGGTVWFNEHYGNKIAELEPAPTATLTEYSESDPPVDSGLAIQNDLTITAVQGGLWITSMTGNYVGFVSGSYKPSFSLSVDGSDNLTVSPGQNASVAFQVTGSWTDTLHVLTSDSETADSVPNLIQIAPNVTSIGPGREQEPLAVELAVSPQIAPGRYTVAVTVSDGLILQTAFVFVTVR